MKKVLVFFLFSILCFRAVHAQFGTEGPLSWEISGGVLTISGNGAMPNYDFASQRPSWYDYKALLQSIIIEEGVTSIGNNAFCESSIHSVTFPESSLKTIGVGAFQYCVNLKSVTIPDGVTHIIGYSFYDCKEMTSFTIGKGVISIGPYVFSGCFSLPAIEVSDGNNYFTSENGVLFSKDKKIFRQYPAAKQGNNYTIPEGVTAIEHDAFESCNELRSVYIPKTVSFIGSWVFGNCSNLNSVIIPYGVTQIGEYCFANCKNLISVSLPASLMAIGQMAFINCTGLTDFSNFSLGPQALFNAFQGSNINGCTLRVPDASIKEYEKFDEWKMFKNIVAFETEFAFSVKKDMSMFAGAKIEIAPTSDNLMFMNTTWKSSNPEVATVNNNGIVTAISQGTTEITATVLGRNAICTMTVVEQGKSSIEGIISNSGTDNVKVNLYIKVEETGLTKRGILGGYVLLATTIPNDNGEYRFEGLPEGSYQVQVEMDEYESEATEELSLSEEVTLADVDFKIDEEAGKILVIADISTGKQELPGTGAGIKIYPNPITDAVRINVETWRAASLRIQIINTAGAVVYTQKINNPDETIHLGHLPAGLYIIRLESGSIVKTAKVVKIQ